MSRERSADLWLLIFSWEIAVQRAICWELREFALRWGEPMCESGTTLREGKAICPV